MYVCMCIEMSMYMFDPMHAARQPGGQAGQPGRQPRQAAARAVAVRGMISEGGFSWGPSESLRGPFLSNICACARRPLT